MDTRGITPALEKVAPFPVHPAAPPVRRPCLAPACRHCSRQDRQAGHCLGTNGWSVDLDQSCQAAHCQAHNRHHSSAHSAVPARSAGGCCAHPTSLSRLCRCLPPTEPCRLQLPWPRSPHLPASLRQTRVSGKGFISPSSTFLPGSGVLCEKHSRRKLHRGVYFFMPHPAAFRDSCSPRRPRIGKDCRTSTDGCF